MSNRLYWVGLYIESASIPLTLMPGVGQWNLMVLAIGFAVCLVSLILYLHEDKRRGLEILKRGAKP